MKTFTKEDCDRIEELIQHFKPNWYEAIIKSPDAALPTAIPETLGMNMVEGMMVCLQKGNDEIRRQCAHEIWYGLPDVIGLHKYRGFHIICNALAAAEDDSWQD